MNGSETINMLRSKGLNVMPLKPRSKEPMFPWAKYQNEKYLDPIPEDANAGVICGDSSGNLVVIDVDTNDKELVDKLLPDAKKHTLVVKTCKGYHIYIKVPKLPRTLRLKNHVGRVDIQSNGAYVVAPWSVHPTGVVYEIISDTNEIFTIDFKIIQNNLEKLGFKPSKSNSLKEIEKNGVTEGSRNNSMFKIACNYLHDLEYDEEIAWAQLCTVNEKLKPPLEIKELRTLFESAKKYDKESENGEAKSTSAELYELAQTQIKKLVISQNNTNEVYAQVEINDHFETLNLNSSRARYWLTHALHTTGSNNRIYGEDFYKNILYSIIAQAQINNTPRESIYKRIAMKNGELFYDLATPDWKAIKITKERIETISLNDTTPFFYRTQSSYQQVFPSFNDEKALNKVAKSLRIVNDEEQLFEVHLTSLFLESYSIPAMVFDGEAGSLKTTATTSVKRIIDPDGIKPEDNCTSMPSNHDDLLIQLYNRYTSSFDNVTKISPEISDILCRAITGSSNSKRELYTNANETIFSFRRKIVLNGIVPTLDYPDLQERIIAYRRYSLDDTERLTEQEYQQQFDVLLPNVLGKIFQTIQKAMDLYEQVKKEVKSKSRLADFEIWGEAISRALGYEPNSFLVKYHEKLSRSSVTAGESHPIVTTIVNLMENKSKYEDTASKCFTTLIEIAKNLGIDYNNHYVRFPKASNQLKKELTTISPVLKRLGIKFDWSTYTKSDGKYTKHSSIVTLTKLESNITEISSPSSPPSLENYMNGDRSASGEGSEGSEADRQ